MGGGLEQRNTCSNVRQEVKQLSTAASYNEYSANALTKSITVRAVNKEKVQFTQFHSIILVSTSTQKNGFQNINITSNELDLLE